MIKIKECHEQLVDIKKLYPDLVIHLDKKRMKKEKTAYLRKTVAEMIWRAKKELPKGMTFIIGDAWRPQSVQQEIRALFIEQFSKRYPNWPKSKIVKEAEIYVAAPDGKFASGHMTGGAVDLRLWKKGRKIPMKSSTLTYQENSRSFQPKLPKYIQRNREIMFTALKKSGLTNYSKEYWHWSYGDIWWAKRNKKEAAIYGVIKNVSY